MGEAGPNFSGSHNFPASSQVGTSVFSLDDGHEFPCTRNRANHGPEMTTGPQRGPVVLVDWLSQLEVVGEIHPADAAGRVVIERATEFRRRNDLFQVFLVGDILAPGDNRPVLPGNTRPQVDSPVGVALGSHYCWQFCFLFFVDTIACRSMLPKRLDKYARMRRCVTPPQVRCFRSCC